MPHVRRRSALFGGSEYEPVEQSVAAIDPSERLVKNLGSNLDEGQDVSHEYVAFYPALVVRAPFSILFFWTVCSAVICGLLYREGLVQLKVEVSCVAT